MPNAYTTNQKPTAYGTAMGLLVDMLVGAGWTVRGSGSGTSGIFIQEPAPTSTVTINTASPAIVTWNTHGLSIGHGVIFTTSGNLPSPLVAGTTYYIAATGFGASSFQISATAGGTSINTTADGSGVHTGTASLKVFSSATSGPTSWNSANSWVRVQDPSGTREFIFQHNNGQSARFKYSPKAKFTGGSPSAIEVPSATDEKLFFGGGTDAAPAYGSWFSTGIVATPPTSIFQGAAMAAAPYGFWFTSQTQGTSLIGGGFSGRASSLMFDPVATVQADTDPYVIYTSGAGFSYYYNTAFARDGGVGTNNVNTWAITPPNSDACFTFVDPTQTQFLYVQPAMYLGISNEQGSTAPGGTGSYLLASGGSVLVTVLGLNPFNGKHEMLPIPYLRVCGGNSSSGNQTFKPMLKGWSTLMRWMGNTRNSFMDVVNDKSWICVGNVWLPWDGVTTPIA